MGNALARLEALVASGYTENRFRQLESALVEIMNTPALTQEENMRLFEVGIGLILQGYPLLEQETQTYNWITGQMVEKGFKSPFDDRFSRNWYWQHPATNLVTHMFKEIVERITPEHETVGYIDLAQVQFGGTGGDTVQRWFCGCDSGENVHCWI